MKIIPVNKVNLFQDQDCLQSTDAYPPKADLPRDASIRRILIIKWGGMGDVVISTAIMQDICNAFPHAEIHLNAMPPWQSLFEHDSRFKKVWTVDLRKQERGILGMLRWLSVVRKNQYDLIVDLQTNDRSRLLLILLKWMGAAPQYLLGNRPLYPYYLRHHLEDQVDIHAFVMMRRMLAAVAIPANTGHPVIYSDPQSTHEAQSLLETYALQAKRFAVFLCGSHAAGLTKRWGIDHYAQLSPLLLEKGVQKIVLVGGNDELKECESIAARHPDIIVNLCGKTTLLQLPTLFKNAKLIIANDTGTAHLAAASETPMLVICGPTNPLRVKPIGQHVIAIQAEIECKNCYQKACDHHSCMLGLTPDKLLSYVDLLK